MNPRSRSVFLALILAQAAHSVEEYVFRLYDVFAPARFISSLFSDDLATGFAIFNAGLVLFGLLCYVAWVRPGRPAARALAWLWIVIELVNGIGHPAIALAQGAYFPGVLTAPVLLALSIYLALRMTRDLAAPKPGTSESRT
jgi:uncharacterized protein with HXXEE motif